jgi:hypothetical protein
VWVASLRIRMVKPPAYWHLLGRILSPVRLRGNCLF